MRKLSLVLMVLISVLGGCDSSSRPIRPASPGDGRGEFELWLKGPSLQGSANGVPLNEHSFYVEVANTDELRQRGLAGREYLPPGKGMLFVMPVPTEIDMWMKGCLIPLDVLFFDQDKRLINFQTMAVPLAGETEADLPRYPSDKLAKYALEVRAGTAQQLRLKQGLTIVVFSDVLLKRLQEGTDRKIKE